MIRGGTGGGNTRIGLDFERKVGLEQAIDAHPDLRIVGNHVVTAKGEVLAEVGEKYEWYREFLGPRGLKPHEDGTLSKRLLPDGYVVPTGGTTAYIVEIKWQTTPGSVDEKLQTCVYKKERYDAMLGPIGYHAQMVYILNEDWFGKPEYRDTLDFMQAHGTIVAFDDLPLDAIGLA